MSDKKKASAGEPTPKPVNEKHQINDQYELVRNLTLPVISISKLTNKGEIVIECLGELTLTQLPSHFAEAGTADAWVIDVRDTDTDETFILATNAVLHSALKRAGEPLKGRSFSIQPGEMNGSTRYRPMIVWEVRRKS